MGRSTFPERDDILYERILDNLEIIPDEEALKSSGPTTVHLCCLGYMDPPCLLHDPSVITLLFFLGGGGEGLMIVPFRQRWGRGGSGKCHSDNARLCLKGPIQLLRFAPRSSPSSSSPSPLSLIVVIIIIFITIITDIIDVIITAIIIVVITIVVIIIIFVVAFVFVFVFVVIIILINMRGRTVLLHWPRTRITHHHHHHHHQSEGANEEDRGGSPIVASSFHNPLAIGYKLLSLGACSLDDSQCPLGIPGWLGVPLGLMSLLTHTHAPMHTHVHTAGQRFEAPYRAQRAEAEAGC